MMLVTQLRHFFEAGVQDEGNRRSRSDGVMKLLNPIFSGTVICSSAVMPSCQSGRREATGGVSNDQSVSDWFMRMRGSEMIARAMVWPMFIFENGTSGDIFPPALSSQTSRRSEGERSVEFPSLSCGRVGRKRGLYFASE